MTQAVIAGRVSGNGGNQVPTRISIEERERLYRIKKYVDGALLTWGYDNGAFRISASVVCETGEELTLRATYNFKYSFCLLYGGTIIRYWDFSKHPNPDKTIIQGGHKHPIATESSDAWAYPVDDVPLDDVNESLLAFLKECNIVLEGGYQRFLLGGH